MTDLNIPFGKTVIRFLHSIESAGISFFQNCIYFKKE